MHFEKPFNQSHDSTGRGTFGPTADCVGSKRRLRGFTLVELLVVIGIIAVLIAILLPALAAVRQQAITMKCLANLRTCGQAFAMYADEHKGRMPYPTTTLGEQYLWFVVLDPYLQTLANSNRTGVASDRGYSEYKQCPLVNNLFNLADNSSDGGVGGQNTTTEYARSYKMNSYLRHYSPVGSGVYSQAKISNIPDASNFVMIGDGVSMDIVGFAATQYDNGQFSMDPSASGPTVASPPLVRHRGACNIVFVDGHAESVKLTTISKPINISPVVNVSTWQTEYIDGSGNPVYLTSGELQLPAGTVRNPAMAPLKWSDLPNLSR